MRTFGTATLVGREWHLRVEPHVAMRLKRWFKRTESGTAGFLRLTHTQETAADLRWFAQRYPLRFEPLKALEDAAQNYHERILRLEEYLAPSYEPPRFELAIQPRVYQAREAQVVHAQGHLLIGDEVGLGKTCAAIAALALPGTLPAVVVTLTHLPRQWRYEIQKFAPQLLVYIPSKATAYPLPTFLGRSPDVVILNYHKLAGWATVLGRYAKTVVFDEVQELRHQGSQRYAAAAELAKAMKYRIGLSATPIFNYGDEIFNVLEILKPGDLGSYTEFVAEWCSYKDAKLVLKNPRAFGSWARENFRIVRHTRQEVGRELPPVQSIVQQVESDAKAFERGKDSATELARIILSKGPSLRGQKMRAAEEFSAWMRQATGLAKAPFVAEFVRLLVEGAGERVVLAGWHRAVYDVWEERLRDLGVAYYTGTESAAEKEQAKQRFVTGDARILFLSLRSGAGLNDLQLASNVIVFGELDWSPGVLEQCIGRLQRDGQERHVVAYYLVSDAGSDPLMVQTLGLKREQVEGICDPQREFIEKLAAVDTDRVRRLAEAYLQRRVESRPAEDVA